jgi:hypothetical protein
MSSMISNPNDFHNGDDAYIPFWVVLESLDAAPPAPFIKCRVRDIGPRRMQSPTGPTEYAGCDLEIKPNLIAPGIPLDYLIKPEHLVEWANKLGDWFRDYPRSLQANLPPQNSI